MSRTYDNDKYDNRYAHHKSKMTFLSMCLNNDDISHLYMPGGCGNDFKSHAMRLYKEYCKQNKKKNTSLKRYVYEIYDKPLYSRYKGLQDEKKFIESRLKTKNKKSIHKIFKSEFEDLDDLIFYSDVRHIKEWIIL